MFVDASALTGILLREADRDDLAGRLEQGKIRATSAMAVWETSIALGRGAGISPSAACRAVIDYLKLADIELKQIPAAAALTAVDAFERYGKGRHPAKLNFGDCFAYACAKELGLPLLFKGQDFSLTDIAAA